MPTSGRPANAHLSDVGIGAPKLISVHIPKCAGTSFLKILGTQYGTGLLLDYDEVPLDPECLFQKDFTAWETTQKRALARDFTNVQAIHGHFWAGKYDEVLPGAPKITWLREPVRRVVSHYYYWKTKPSLPNSLHRLFVEKQCSLAEFIEFPIMQNAYTNTFLRGHVLNDFAFVGVCEFFAEDMQRLQRQLGWSEVTLPQENRTEHPEYSALQVDPALEHRIRQLNAADMDLYRTALDLRNKQSRRAVHFA